MCQPAKRPTLGRERDMAELVKPLYVMVVDDVETKKKEKERVSFRYMRSTLQSTLQLMGCKPRHAFKISQRVIELIRGEASADALLLEATPSLEASVGSLTGKLEADCRLTADEDGKDDPVPFQQYKKRTTVVVRRTTFLNVVYKALVEYNYIGPNQRADLVLACRIRERKESVIVLLCGTSGCGKSTLSALLGSRLGITTVISTDSIRHMMRSFASEKENPLLWASTYHAGECLDPEAVAEAKAKKKANKLAGVSHSTDGSTIANSHGVSANSNITETISPKQMVIEGFKAQSEMVIDSLDRLITAWEGKKESVVVEGVHLSLNFVMGLMKKHPSIIPFMIYIANEEKHLERFAVRAKYMTLDPLKNKYVKYIRNIRTIQEYLCKGADKHLVPKVNNTNVDKSVAAIHATVFSCLRRRATGEQLYDSSRNIVTVVDEEYRNQCTANSVTSKGVFQLIQRKGSSRKLMALLNNDGSVAKTWLVDAINLNVNPTVNEGTNSHIEDSMYGPMHIGKAEPVNLQFGHFGISAWPNDGATSNAGSYDDSRADWTDTSSRYHSSCGNSPRLSEGPSKELKEDNLVHGSDEEVDDASEADSEFTNDDDGDRHEQDEVGSVDESTKSDEEYDDLAMLDVQETCYWSANDDSKDKLTPLPGVELSHMHSTENLDLFGSTENDLQETLCVPPSLLTEKNENTLPPCGDLKSRRHAQSIPVLDKHGTLLNDPIMSGVLPR